MSTSRIDELKAAIERYNVSIPAASHELLAAYLDSLWSWNEKINLTRHDTMDKFVARDLLDTVQLSMILEEGCEVLDMGTGGGLPGIPLSIIRPDLEVSLCESVGKKAKVVDEIVQTLSLPIPVHQCRAEEVLEDCRFDYVVARGVGPLWKMCQWLEPHWPGLRALLAIKGPKWVEERKEARHRGFLREVELRKVAEYKTLEEEPRYSAIIRVGRAEFQPPQ